LRPHLRNLGILAALFLGLAASGEAAAQATGIDTKAATAERVLGNADAPITIVEYAALTCPHCAEFHEKILPGIKKDFIDNGQVKIVFRDYPFEKNGLAAAMMARCVSPERFFAVQGMIFKSQKTWLTAQDPMAELQKVGRFAGISPQQFESCMANKELQDAVIQSRFEAEKKHRVNSTPTFIINDGKARVEGAKEQELRDALVKLGAKPATAAK